MSQLTVSLFGSYEVHLGEKSITEKFRTVKERALLAYLMVESQASHSREALAEFFWPDRPESSGRMNLRQALYGLRMTMERDDFPGLLQGDDEFVRINLEAEYDLDVQFFMQSYSRILDHQHDSIDTCKNCNEHLASAVERYKGDFLTGFSVDGAHRFQEWISFQRETYFQKNLIALQHLINYFTNQFEYDKAFHYARRQVKTAPLEEKGHRQMMRLFVKLGRRTAAIDQYQTCKTLLFSEFGVAPSVETRQLYQSIREGLDDMVGTPAPAKTISPVQKKLPIPLTSFIGREQQLDDLSDCLKNDNCRLITIIGIGGVGKTRIAIEAARNAERDFSDGVWFVSLQNMSGTRNLGELILNQLDVRMSENASAQGQLISHFRDLHALIVLDHYDRWIESTPILLELLQHAPNVKIILTGRDRVNYQAACLFDVPGMVVPEDEVDPFSYPVVQLFLSRNQNRQGRPVNEQVALQHITEICRLLGGHPLAIELAAVQAHSTPLEELVKLLSVSLSLLQTDQFDVPERHRSLEKVFEKSWLTLSEQEQRVFASAAIFSGPFCLRAAHAITGTSREVLKRLLDASMFAPAEQDQFSLHPVLKTYAMVKLGQDPQLEREIIQKHYRYYLGLLHSRAEDIAKGRDLNFLIRKLTKLLPNLERAAENAAEAGELELLEDTLTPLNDLYELSGRLRNGLSTFSVIENKLVMLPDVVSVHRLLGRVVGNVAWFYTRLGRVHGALEAYSRAMSLLSDPESESARPFPLFGNAFLFRRIGRNVEARKLFIRSQILARKHHDSLTATLSELLCIEIDIESGKVDNPIETLQKVFEAFREIGNVRGQVRTLIQMGDAACKFDECIRGKMFYSRALDLVDDMDAPWSRALILEKMGRVAFRSGAVEEALEDFNNSLKVFRAIGDQWRIVTTLTELGELALVDNRLKDAEETFDEALNKAIDLDSDVRLVRVFVGIAGLYSLSGENSMAAHLTNWLLNDESFCVLANEYLSQLSKKLNLEMLKIPDKYLSGAPSAVTYSGEFVVDEYSLWRNRKKYKMLSKQ